MNECYAVVALMSLVVCVGPSLLPVLPVLEGKTLKQGHFLNSALCTRKL